LHICTAPIPVIWKRKPSKVNKSFVWLHILAQIDSLHDRLISGETHSVWPRKSTRFLSLLRPVAIQFDTSINIWKSPNNVRLRSPARDTRRLQTIFGSLSVIFENCRRLSEYFNSLRWMSVTCTLNQSEWSDSYNNKLTYKGIAC